VVIEDFTTKVFDEVYLAYTRFVNTMVQRPTIRKILPIEPTVAEARSMAEYIFEPDPQTILAEVVPRFTELQVYQAVLESIASEHSARMVAMRSATDNAKDLLGVLTLTFNKVRQAGITMEMLDIVGGAEALRRAQAAR
jgi:F-type H+-transporting ATPase subunit gamma